MLLTAVLVFAAACQSEPKPEDKAGKEEEGVSYPEGATSSPWSIAGINGEDSWNSNNVALKMKGDWHIALGVKAAANAEFKFRKNGNWDVNFGASGVSFALDKEIPLAQGGGNFRISKAGKYDFYLAPVNGIMVVLESGGNFSHAQAGIPLKGGIIAGASAAETTRPSGLTYQLNVYSFADSDGDGWGDFQGIIDHLDYFESLGVSALWLSPIQPAQSYHSYDITDYASIRAKFGGKNATESKAEEKFQELVNEAKAKNIDIYLDYVLNHSGDQCPWFQQAVADPESEYRKYYVFSDDYKTDVANGNVDNFAGGKDPVMGGWHVTSTGGGYTGRVHFKVDWNAKTVTVSKADGQDLSPTAGSPKIWIHVNKTVGMQETSSGIHEITVDMNTDWGFLVRTSSTSWDGGTKWGGDGSGIEFDKPFKLNNTTAANITFGGKASYFFASFDKSMPDLNYGKYFQCENSPAFIDLAGTADKWITMGVNGLRLDAVMWIYQCNTEANVEFLSKWYDHCNTTYHNLGRSGDLYMVAETWADSVEQMAPYYKGLPSHFNFYYWWTLSDRINSGKGSDFASTVVGFRNKIESNYNQRKYAHSSGYYDAIKLSNHDENRAASTLGENDQKVRLAGAVLLTSEGKPYIYQGEELGYWGVKDNGDEYVRTPMYWTAGGRLASSPLGSKVNNSMLKALGSVEEQGADDKSLLSLYRRFASARNQTPALYKGRMEPVSSGSNAVAAWYMNEKDGSGKCLVLHNFSREKVDVTLPGGISVPSANMSLSGTAAELKTKAGGNPYLLISNSYSPLSVSSDGRKLAMPALSSAVIALQ